MRLINEKIKELYGSKASFCEKEGYSYKDFASKLRTFKNRFDWLNKFLEPLNLEVLIAFKKQCGEDENNTKEGGSDETPSGH